MGRKIHIGLAVLAVAFIASGCVSTGTFDKMQAEKNEEIKKLQQQNADLEQQKKTLEEQRSSLEQKNMTTQQQVGTLEQQKAALLAASQQQQQQYDALVQGLSKEVEQGQLQVRQ
ncbi:MAG: hypothetical protein WA635_00760 [Gallionella sp.]